MRKPEKNIEKQFIERWSGRKHSGTKLTEEQIESLIEAARWAPSSYNEQPWRFCIPKTEEENKAYFSLLAEGNQEWVKNTGFLCFIVTKRILTKTGEPNRFCTFDAGSAWMSLALQAHAMGLNAHAMGGFDVARSYETLSVDEKEYEVLAGIAVGVPTEKAKVEEEKTPRKEREELLI